MYEHDFQWRSLYGGGKRHALIVPDEGYELLALCRMARRVDETYNPPRPNDKSQAKCKTCLGILAGTIDQQEVWDNPRRIEELPDMYQQTRTINRADRIEAQIEALEAERLRLLTLPEDMYEEGDVVHFTKTFGASGSHLYTYAALKHAGRWYVTQSHDTVAPMSWDQLLEFVGDGELWAAVEWEQVQ